MILNVNDLKLKPTNTLSEVLKLIRNEKLFSVECGGVKPYYVSPTRLKKYSSELSIPTHPQMLIHTPIPNAAVSAFL